MRPLRIGIIGSSNGSALRKSLGILKATDATPIQFVIISDRQCGIVSLAQEKDIPHYLIAEPDNRLFSQKSRDTLDSIGGVDIVLLFFTRLITAELLSFYPCVNIHPALLPLFKGMDATQQFINSGCRFLGCSLHLINEQLDDGPIIAQVCSPMPLGADIALVNRYSYIQKIYLTLLLLELLMENKLSVTPVNFTLLGGLAYNAYANPCITDSPTLQMLVDYQNSLGIKVVE